MKGDVPRPMNDLRTRRQRHYLQRTVRIIAYFCLDYIVTKIITSGKQRKKNIYINVENI